MTDVKPKEPVAQELYRGFFVQVVQLTTTINGKAATVYDASAIDEDHKFWSVGKSNIQEALLAIRATVDQALDDDPDLVRTDNHRGYRLVVYRLKPDSMGHTHRGSAVWQGEADKDVPVLYALDFGAVLCLDQLRRHIDYWLGVDGVESLSNADLANLLVQDLVPDIPNRHARFMLEVADRLRSLDERGILSTGDTASGAEED